MEDGLALDGALTRFEKVVGHGLRLAEGRRAELKNQLLEDTELLRQLKVMDYSLLLVVSAHPIVVARAPGVDDDARRSGDDELHSAATSVLAQFHGDIVYTALGPGTAGYTEDAAARRSVLTSDGDAVTLALVRDAEASREPPGLGV